MKPNFIPRKFSGAAIGLLAVLALAAAGCSTDDSPSSPTQPPAGPTPPIAPAGFTVSVTVNPGSLDAAASSPSTVTVTVRANSGAALPANSTVKLNTNLGAFGSASGSTEVTLDLVNGQAQAFLGNGSAGVATVRATFTTSTGENFTGSASLEFRAPTTFFISSVSPGNGNAQGGEIVTILGGGFDPPLRVLFGGTPATVISSTATQIRVRTPQTAVPAGTGAGLGVGHHQPQRNRRGHRYPAQRLHLHQRRRYRSARALVDVARCRSERRWHQRDDHR